MNSAKFIAVAPTPGRYVKRRGTGEDGDQSTTVVVAALSRAVATAVHSLVEQELQAETSFATSLQQRVTLLEAC